MVEGRSDAVALPYLVEEPHSVGGAQFLHLSVIEQMLDYGMVATKLLQRRRVGAVARLRLLLRGELEPLEEDLAQLLGRVDVELFSRRVVDQSTKSLYLRSEVVPEAGQLRDIDADANGLHSGQHLDQWDFDCFVERREALGFHGRPDRFDQCGHRQGVARGEQGHIGLGLSLIHI